MIHLEPFKRFRLHGGFVVQDVETVPGLIVDAVGREASAHTRVQGQSFHLLMRSGMNDGEMSVTLYHEILEAAAVAVDYTPAGVEDFCEADFVQAGYEAFKRWGDVSPENLSLMLIFHGFREE